MKQEESDSTSSSSLTDVGNLFNNQFDRLGAGKVKQSIKVKFAVVTIISLLIGPILANYLYNLINTSGLIPAAYAVLFSTLINLVVVTGIVVFLANRIIIKPINKLVLLTVAMAKGDLTQKSAVAEQQDEIGRLAQGINVSIDNNNNLIKEVQIVSQEIATSSDNLSSMTNSLSQMTDQIVAAINQVSQGNTEQNENVLEAAKTLAGLSSMIQMTAAQADSIKQIARETIQKANEGEQAVLSTIAKMEAIETQVQNSSDQVKDLVNHTNQIGAIVDTILGISTQTNLLALNAAIEAARAGEHGRGFAVVAEEVRHLAEESSNSTGKISEIIEAIQESTAQTLSEMERGQTEVSEGSKVVRNMGTLFQAILEAVETTVAGVEKIAELTNEQVVSSNEAVELIDRTASFAESTAASSQEVSASAEQQSSYLYEIAQSVKNEARLAEQLEEKISGFKVS